jgi:hypothetical protein
MFKILAAPHMCISLVAGSSWTAMLALMFRVLVVRDLDFGLDSTYLSLFMVFQVKLRNYFHRALKCVTVSFLCVYSYNIPTIHTF